MPPRKLITSNEPRVKRDKVFELGELARYTPDQVRLTLVVTEADVLEFAKRHSLSPVLPQSCSSLYMISGNGITLPVEYLDTSVWFWEELNERRVHRQYLMWCPVLLSPPLVATGPARIVTRATRPVHNCRFVRGGDFTPLPNVVYAGNWYG
jgi:hypothetical protein